MEDLTELAPGAFLLAVKATPFEAMVGTVYGEIKKRARNELARDLFGPKGEGIHTSTLVVPLPLHLDPLAPWLAKRGTFEEILERELPLEETWVPPECLSRVEREAIFYEYYAREQGYSRKEYCEKRGLSYDGVRQAFSRARKKLRKATP